MTGFTLGGACFYYIFSINHLFIFAPYLIGWSNYQLLSTNLYNFMAKEEDMPRKKDKNKEENESDENKSTHQGDDRSETEEDNLEDPEEML
jgi:hypothetical protein